jgi:two-component system response regulator (stage 0 sporulation protein F)
MANVLIVDDENNIRLMLRIALKAEGHDVMGAADGLEALELFGTGGQFDLVLLDQRMPGMEGLEVLRAMRKCDQSVKIVMTTAFGTVDLAREAMEAGANGFLRKPFTTEVLRATVAAALADEVPVGNADNTHFDAVSVNGFRLESVGDDGSIEHHKFKIHGPQKEPTVCVVQLPPFFIELVKARADRDNLQEDTAFWNWLSEEALANYLWQNSASPDGGRLVLDELTSNLGRWMDAVLAPQ